MLNIKSMDELQDLINDESLDDRYDAIVDEYVAKSKSTGECWFEDDMIVAYNANPYEKALVVDYYDNPSMSCASCTPGDVRFNRANGGTDWQWEHPEALEIAETAGLHDPDLIGYDDVTGLYTFRDHTDRFAYMSDDFRMSDHITKYVVSPSGAVIEKR